MTYRKRHFACCLFLLLQRQTTPSFYATVKGDVPYKKIIAHTKSMFRVRYMYKYINKR